MTLFWTMTTLVSLGSITIALLLVVLWRWRWRWALRGQKEKCTAAELSGMEELPPAGMEYWGARFRMLAVRELAGCTFEQYLKRPYYFERIARARREAARRRREVRG